MPRKKGYKTPSIEEGIFRYTDPETQTVTQELDINKYPDAWLTYFVINLKSVRVVYTEPHTGFKYSCTFVRRKHPSYKPKDEDDKRILGVWYGNRTIGGKQRRKYVGKNENMTLDRMHQIAKELSQGQMDLQPRLFDPDDEKLTTQKRLL